MKKETDEMHGYEDNGNTASLSGANNWHQQNPKTWDSKICTPKGKSENSQTKVPFPRYMMQTHRVPGEGLGVSVAFFSISKLGTNVKLNNMQSWKANGHMWRACAPFIFFFPCLSKHPATSVINQKLSMTRA